MSGSPFVRTEVRRERSSDAPISVDLSRDSVDTGRTSIPIRWASRIPRSWIRMSGYVVAGVFLGLVLIVAFTLARGDSSAAAASAGVVTDNVVHLKAKQLSASCWRGTDSDEAARVTVSLEVGLDGKVRNAIAAGESPAMRACIESHVKSWQFLPQANPSQMVLPFEIDPR
jgi:hypothetical protein